MDLRSNHPVGSPRWATRRAQWRVLGVRPDDLERPKIAIVNSSSGLAPCFSHLDPIAQHVKDAIYAAGGLGFEIRTVAPTDFIMAAGRGGGYVLSSRDLLADDIEAVVEGAQLDGMVCLASCDKTTPGQLMAAARLDVPTVVVSCGYQSCGILDSGERADIEEVFIRAGHVARGGTSVEGLCDLADRAIQGPGVCTGMGTANSMHIMAEALGMALPGSTPVRADSERMWDAAREAGRAIVELIARDLRPRDIMTPAAFQNAAHALIAVSGSINCVKHLRAIAREGEVDVDFGRCMDIAADSSRALAAVRPNGEDTIEDFEDSGGALGVLAALGANIDGSVATVSGGTLGEAVAAFRAPPDSIIAPLDGAGEGSATILILRGSLAPTGGIVKLSVSEERPSSFRGPARVFGSAVDAIDALDAGEVRRGEVLVLRGLGPVGMPGMGMASNVVFAANGAGLTEHIAVVTDGQLSGLVNKGIVVGEITPEAALGGPLDVVETGDVIEIDIGRRSIDLRVPGEVLETRRRHASPTGTAPGPGWLSLYASAVEDLALGAVVRPAARRRIHPTAVARVETEDVACRIP
ncbi:dihydroxy-acid dehydratase [Microbacterium sp. 18062]|uniref:dihydroxy-acid dehydratase domain-containing protein n=1 Tax=Microbacterium sp. 18062 TaxID=2681410 RepID=UPI001357F01A|nr:dihydroxy-acid dehydratase [Microbacterium sp. 18062]